MGAIVESKDEIRERLGRSPDKADAFVMANWVRKRAVPAVKSKQTEKEANRAMPLIIRDGKVVAVKREPKTPDELAAQFDDRLRRGGRLAHRERVPRRRYD